VPCRRPDSQNELLAVKMVSQKVLFTSVACATLVAGVLGMSAVANNDPILGACYEPANKPVDSSRCRIAAGSLRGHSR
jgi:hypothetical protein